MTQDYYGTKRITAWEQDGPAKVRICGVDCRPGEDPCNGYCSGDAARPPPADPQPGYAVKYADGYISWSPKAVFEEAYQPITAMSFGHAIEALKAGHRVARAGWNGKDMFLFLVPGSHFKVNRPPLLGIYPEGTGIDYCPHIDLKTTDNKVVPWLASQTDMLATDWSIVGAEHDS